MKLIAPHPSQCYSSKYGDIVFECGKWFLPIQKKELQGQNCIHLKCINAVTWTALEYLKIEHLEFKESAKYRCPYTGYEHFGCMPLAVFTSDKRRYLSESDLLGILGDDQWMQQMRGDDEFEPGKITKILLGSGYTNFTRIHDGHSNLIHVSVPIDNGDRLLCIGWEWYNK